MSNRLNRPWLHFLVLGTAFFFLMRWLYPPPIPVVGPLGDSRVENLQRQWFSTAGRPATPAQLQGMVRAELDRDMLFQEALRLELHLYDSVVHQRLIKNMRFLRLGEGKTDQELYKDALRMELHLGDEVVKRRLIQAMEQLLLAQSRLSEPSETDLRQRFESQTEQLRRPPRYSFEHVFLTRDRASEAEALLARIETEQRDGSQARELSSPFLPGYRFRSLSPQQIARHFGAAFVLNLQQAEPSPHSWFGPIESTYGLHLVWMGEIEEARDARLEEVRDQLARDLVLERRNNALRDAVSRVRENYEVVL